MKDILQQFDKKFVAFKRPQSCVDSFWAYDCDGVYHKLQEIQAKSFLEEALNTQKKKIKEMIYKIELDEKAHSQGKCSFNLMALCSAEEQKIKMSLLKAIDKL